jgi:hypothetical protein
MGCFRILGLKRGDWTSYSQLRHIASMGIMPVSEPVTEWCGERCGVTKLGAPSRGPEASLWATLNGFDRFWPPHDKFCQNSVADKMPQLMIFDLCIEM